MRFFASANPLRLILSACLALALALVMPDSAQAGHKAPAPDKRGILLVAFGTTDAEGAKTYDSLKAQTEKTFPGVPVRLAYTSARARKTPGATVDRPSPAQALARMADEGVTQVAVQSLHIMPGKEFHDLAATAMAMEGLPKGLKKVALGLPLLSGTDDLKMAAQALVDGARKTGKPSEAVVFIGHGTEHPGNMAYPALQYFLWQRDRLALVGVIDGAPSLGEVLAELKNSQPTSVRLVPLLSVAGEHAKSDIGGSGKGSWQSVISAAGFACTADLRGLLERPEMVALWLDHLRDAVKELDD